MRCYERSGAVEFLRKLGHELAEQEKPALSITTTACTNPPANGP